MPSRDAQQAAAEAQRLLRTGDYRRALGLTAQLHRAFPLAPPVAAMHAEALLRVGRARQANLAIGPVLGLGRSPFESASLRMLAARAAHDAGATEDAVAHLRKALELRPGEPEVIRLLVDRLLDLDRADEAADLMGPRPSAGTAPVWLRLCQRRGEPGAAVAPLEAVASPDAPASVWFALGAAREATGDFAGAFEAYAHANARMEVRPRPGEDRAREFAATEAARTIGGVPEELPEGAARVVLIVGMPRSGTSLVEEILCRHSQVGACGESQALPWAAGRVCRDVTRSLTPTAEERQVAAARAAYLDELAAASARDGATVLTDKNPMNLFLLPVAARLLPGLRVVRCRRDAADTCFSCFASPLGRDHRYACDLGDCGRFYASAERVLDAAAARLDGRVHDVVYEDLVARPEPVVRGMLGFLGLGFEDACLRPQGSGRVVRTISRDQVRAGIHAGSVGRASRFGERVSSLRSVLAAEGVGAL
jgi:tetratricopeptide (TPR) repeat protein